MMAGLFLIFCVVLLLIWFGYRTAALILGMINLLFALAIFWYHVDTVVNILL